ncbi:AraC family ligand binding domain-containing protein [Streptomyces sp. NPDC056255]|uniref:AraC family ligand binding domain-containing protein n=1 Tax=Streptomyces sp. NPDC056255 TaxID=3345764 RepID=UPI0035DBCC02
MDARFEQYANLIHAHDTYSFGIADDVAQSSVCRGERSSVRPDWSWRSFRDELHDERSAVHHGYRYRMPHLGEDLVREVLADKDPGRTGLLLFGTPVVENPALARAVACLHTAVVKNTPRLVVEELITASPGPGAWTRGPDEDLLPGVTRTGRSAAPALDLQAPQYGRSLQNHAYRVDARRELHPRPRPEPHREALPVVRSLRDCLDCLKEVPIHWWGMQASAGWAVRRGSE